MSVNLINAIMSAAQRAPETPLIVQSQSRPCETSLAEIVHAGRVAGAHFANIGIEPGDIVGVMLPNWREWLVACVACWQAGAVMLPIVTIYGSKELEFIMRQSRTRILITPDNWRGIDYRQVVTDCGALEDLILHVRVGDNFEILEAPVDFAEPAQGGPNELAMLVYTSGTTANPKGVMHSSKTLLAELEAQTSSRGKIENEVILTPWPPGHVAGALSLLRFLAGAVPLVAMDVWEAASAAELIDRYKVTSSSGTPFHLAGVIDAADRDMRDLGSLRNYIVGAAPVPPSLIERALANKLAVYHCYGSSEHPTITSGVADDPLDKQLNTEGRVMQGSELRFVDDDGNDVPAGNDGEIATRGGELFIGYFDPSLNAKAFLEGGWYLTGDIGRLDEDGYLLITDRKKDIIIRGGENISSKEVEAVLLCHPAIADAAVVAAPDERLGEIVRAVVVAKAGQSVALDDIRAHFSSSGVAKQKTPEILSLIDALPRNASGKVLKHALRDEA